MNSKIDWSRFAPAAPLPDTGEKKFELDQVWAFRTPHAREGSVVRIKRLPSDPGVELSGHADVEVLCGYSSGYLGQDSVSANHARLVPAHEYAPLPKFEPWSPQAWPTLKFEPAMSPSNSESEPWLPKALDLAFEPLPAMPRPRWVDVVERILVKANEHRVKGRGDEGFRQVFVPKADFEALKDFFGGDEPYVWTPIGLVSVHPVNPDGATFSD